MDETVKAAAAAAAAADKLNEEMERAIRVQELRSRCAPLQAAVTLRVKPSCCAGWLRCKMMRDLRLSLGGGRRASERRVRT
jgi:hypothetical protein